MSSISNNKDFNVDFDLHNILNSVLSNTKINSKEITLLKAYSKALQQMHEKYKAEDIGYVLSLYPEFSYEICKLFEIRFCPTYKDSRDIKQKNILEKIQNQLTFINKNDHNYICCLVLNCVQSTVRTNFYQSPHKDFLSLKFDSAHLMDLPKPYPLYEIFIYSDRIEACHLRTDKISRGGIRWSGRIEDFRYETLNLMKAQMVKNAIIVPMGAKGSFICKYYEHLKSSGASLQILKKEVEDCYQIMMQGLLDLTDNIVEKKVSHPENTICYDGEDPYLVVAADKGTSAFSDLANKIAKNHNFWLKDAFASGGSNGYDHKQMGITAKGAWISVEHHFQEIGINIDHSFTVIGIGDMSGDIFGNGMLHSKNIRLLAAFNHQHIFIDPHPDLEKSFTERQRLFNRQNSSWADYDLTILSTGGGVFNRKEQFISLTHEIKTLLNINDSVQTITPDELIKILLKAPVDLLWFGGIGTFVKSSKELTDDVHDHQNDSVRINGKDLKARVIGEGANLGLTQLARIEYAMNGGKINMDAIDNSGGVDCSDYEVNLKILFSQFLEQKIITLDERNKFLNEMHSDVQQHVLKDNFLQNHVLNFMEYSSLQKMSDYQSLIHYLEQQEKYSLNREVEFLPTDENLKQRRFDNKGLTRPELAIILSYSKIALYGQLVENFKIEKDAIKVFDAHYQAYFPALIRDQFNQNIHSHPLKQEILATLLSNKIINFFGPCQVWELVKIPNISLIKIMEVFCNIIDEFKFDKLWEALANSKDIKEEKYQLFALLHKITYQLILFYMQGSLNNPLINSLIIENIDELYLKFPPHMIELILLKEKIKNSKSINP